MKTEKFCPDHATTIPEMVYTVTVIGNDDYDMLEALTRLIANYQNNGTYGQQFSFDNEEDGNGKPTVFVTSSAFTTISD